MAFKSEVMLVLYDFCMEEVNRVKLDFKLV